jgi:hypothetical protein
MLEIILQDDEIMKAKNQIGWIQQKLIECGVSKIEGIDWPEIDYSKGKLIGYRDDQKCRYVYTWEPK